MISVKYLNMIMFWTGVRQSTNALAASLTPNDSAKGWQTSHKKLGSLLKIYFNLSYTRFKIITNNICKIIYRNDCQTIQVVAGFRHVEYHIKGAHEYYSTEKQYCFTLLSSQECNFKTFLPPCVAMPEVYARGLGLHPALPRTILPR